MKTTTIHISRSKALLNCCIAALCIAATVCLAGSAQLHGYIKHIASEFFKNLLSWNTI